MIVLAVASQKSGVGKSAVALNLATTTRYNETMYEVVHPIEREQPRSADEAEALFREAGQALTPGLLQSPVSMGPQAAPNPGLLQSPVSTGPQAAPNPGLLQSPDRDESIGGRSPSPVS